VTLSLTVSPDGNSAVLDLQPVMSTDKNTTIQLHTESLRQAGFEAPANATLEVESGKSFRRTFTRRK
jgi:hypothetical protein